MIAELCGARLLAPVFGSSLYVWASAMGITLFALAAGYFVGAYLSLRNQKEKMLTRVLVIAALSILFMPVVASYVSPSLSTLPLLLGVVISTIFIVLPPVFCLGASSPLFIAIQTNDQQTGGLVSGVVYAVSTLGGIVATFVAGFYLLPIIGLQFTCLAVGLALFIFSAIVFKLKEYLYYVVLMVALYFQFKLWQSTTNSLYSSEGILGQVQVIAYTENNREKRALLMNKIVQTEMDLLTKTSDSDYLKLLDTLVSPAKGLQAALVLGLGGGQSAGNLHKKKYTTTAVEFDERVSAVAVDYFFLNDSIELINADARYFINNTKKKYQIILADLYRAEEQPAHLFTLESLKTMFECLEKNGKLYISWHGYTSAEKGMGTKVLLQTLSKAGFKYQVHSTGAVEDARNLIIEASNDVSFEPSNKAHLLQVLVEDNTPINTDNTLNLERYNAAAHQAWRQLYIAYYRSQTKF